MTTPTARLEDKAYMAKAQPTLDRVMTRIKEGLTEADGLRVSNEDTPDVKITSEDEDSVLRTGDPTMKILGASIDGVDLSITVNLTP